MCGFDDDVSSERGTCRSVPSPPLSIQPLQSAYTRQSGQGSRSTHLTATRCTYLNSNRPSKLPATNGLQPTTQANTRPGTSSHPAPRLNAKFATTWGCKTYNPQPSNPKPTSLPRANATGLNGYSKGVRTGCGVAGCRPERAAESSHLSTIWQHADHRVMRFAAVDGRRGHWNVTTGGPVRRRRVTLPWRLPQRRADC